VTTALTAGEVFEEAELLTVDARFRVRGTQPSPTDVAVVAVDAATLAATPDPWPFSLGAFADVVAHLRDAGAAVIVLDVPFGPGDDAPGAERFMAELTRTDAIVLATARTTPDGSPAVLGGPRTLDLPGVEAADARFDPDDDGVVRRIDHTILPSEDDDDEERAVDEQLDAGVVPTIAVVAARAATGVDVAVEEFGEEGATIDHRGPAGTVSTVSWTDVVRGDVDPGTVRGRVVLVGPTAPALQDRFPTPLAEHVSGTEIHATAVATVLDDFPLATLPLPLRLGIVLALCLLPLAVIRLRTGPALAAIGGLALLYVVASLVAFHADLLVPVLPVLLGLTVAAVAVGASGYVTEARGGARLLRAFSRYVPEVVAQDAVREDRTGGDLLRAIDRDATILFSDLRGFTTMSQTRTPDEVVRVLNDYLSAMANVIIAEGGVVTGYLGDGIMAVFGVPEASDDHADRALAAAIAMLERLQDVNDALADRLGGDRLRMGIGLNSGPVTAGNLGSEQRLEYSVVGDAVNTAARIEGLTKQAPFALLVADETRQRLSRQPDDIVAYDTTTIRGRTGKVTLWSLERTREQP